MRLYAGVLVELTAEVVRRSSRDNAVIVTWASSAYLDFLRNWVHHLTSLDVDNILIGESNCSLASIGALCQSPFQRHQYRTAIDKLQGYGDSGSKELKTMDLYFAGAMDETAAAYLREEGLPYFTMFGQGSNPYKDLKGEQQIHKIPGLISNTA